MYPPSGSQAVDLVLNHMKYKVLVGNVPLENSQNILEIGLFHLTVFNESEEAVTKHCGRRYRDNNFLLEEQELNDLRVSLKDAEHLFEVTISKKLHVCELLCKMKGSSSVCLKKYKEGEELGILHCSHEFHTDCIKIWLLCKNVFPLCKAIGIPI
nr:hypothetical protein [Tanacetum cinerariifolium]